MKPPDRLARLAARREALVALGQVQRELVALRWRGVEPSLQWAERGWQAWRYARSHPWAVFAPVALMAALRPRWTGRVVAGLMAITRLRRLLR
jgi:hypothetical protein